MGFQNPYWWAMGEVRTEKSQSIGDVLGAEQGFCLLSHSLVLDSSLLPKSSQAPKVFPSSCRVIQDFSVRWPSK